MKHKKRAFSLVELMVTLIVISVIISAMTPMITKKLKSQAITVGSGGNQNIEFQQDCSAWSEDCVLCTETKCNLCMKECLSNQYTQTSTCACSPCTDFNSNCLECSSKQCKKCANGYYVNGITCTICPIGSYCDGITKTTCEEGQYTDSTGQTFCKDCEVGYACTGGIKSECNAGTYSTSNSSSCTTCEKGYKCPGVSNRIQCTGNEYQDLTGQSTCKACSSGYYISNDRAACTICPSGNYCSGDGTKNQCSAGTYASATGLTSCTNCSKGYFSSANASSCTKCPAGKYNEAEGSSSCTTCPKGYYCTGGSNKTSCGDGKYLDTTGNDASSDCKSCSSKTANCAKCNLTTGACTTCEEDYILDNTACIPACGDELTIKLTLNGKEVCMMKYNVGDDAYKAGIEKGTAFAIPSSSGVSIVTAGTSTCSSSSSKPCCWVGTTSGGCNSNNGGYSGCTRTVCDWWAAHAICSKITYLNKTWRVPTSNEWSSIGTQFSSLSPGKGSDGLMLCSYESLSTSAYCYTSVGRCYGSGDGDCAPCSVWANEAVSSTTAYRHRYSNNSSGLYGPDTRSKAYAHSVRCIADL